MKKILHFTHIDSDALGCDVLIKYYYEKVLGDYKVETHYITNSNVDRFIEDTMNKCMTDIEVNTYPENIYDIIYITDIGPATSTVNSIIDYTNLMKHRFDHNCIIYGFDHHVTNRISDFCPFFVVANNLYTLYKYPNRHEELEAFIDKDSSFTNQYYPFPWMHDHTVKVYKSIDDVDPSKSMSISATFLVYLHIMTLIYKDKYDMKLVDNLLGYMVREISCYDTWEWKTNKYMIQFGIEDRASKLVDMLGIIEATKTVLDTLRFPCDPNDENKPSYYIPEKFKIAYEYDKFKAFKYVEHSYNNVRVLTGMHIKGFYNILGIPHLYDPEIQKVFISISDNTVDLGEQSTFITTYFADCKCLFAHVFVSTRALSFRSNIKHDVDVSVIARELGGGGHVTAAGVRLNADIIGKLVVMYHINAESLTDMNPGTDLVAYTTKLMEYAKTLPELETFEYCI